jgi:hypothetical protein
MSEDVLIRFIGGPQEGDSIVAAATIGGWPPPRYLELEEYPGGYYEKVSQSQPAEFMLQGVRYIWRLGSVPSQLEGPS